MEIEKDEEKIRDMLKKLSLNFVRLFIDKYNREENTTISTDEEMLKFTAYVIQQTKNTVEAEHRVETIKGLTKTFLDVLIGILLTITAYSLINLLK